jgi:hypothetical protein
MAKLSGTFLTPDDDTESMLRKLLQLPPLPQNVSRAAKMATNKTSDPAGVPIPVGGSAGGAAAAPGPGTVVHHDVPPEEGVVHHTAPPTSGAAPPAAATGGVMQHGPASGTEGQTVHHDLSDTDDEDEDE